MSFKLDLSSLLNLTAVGLGGLAVYKMLTVVLGKPSETPVIPVAFQDNLFVDSSESFDEFWEFWTRNENRGKAKGATVYFLRLEGKGPNTWGVRFDNYSKYFLIDGFTKDSIIRDANLHQYNYVTK